MPPTSKDGLHFFLQSKPSKMSTDAVICDNIINGQSVPPKNGQYRDVFAPADGHLIARCALSTPEELDVAVAAAKQAFEGWSTMPIKRRCELLMNLYALFKRDMVQLCETVTLENGKNDFEARGSVEKANEVIAFAASIYHVFQGQIMDVSTGVQCCNRREPLGVVASITPFNFPMMVPNWTIPIAIACGNTVILKCSEKVPISSQHYLRLVKEAGIPDGVINLVNGEAPIVEAICDHPDIKAVSFVGSTHVADLVYQRSIRNHKRAMCMGGAKNFLVALPDCDLEMTASDITSSFTGCAGERCMAASVLVVVGENQELLDKVCARAAALQPGQTRGELGPVIDLASRDRIIGYINDAEKSGARILVDGRSWAQRDPGFWVGATVIEVDSVTHPVITDEIFGPVLTVIRAATREEALRMQQSSRYGNAACVYTNSGAHADWFTHRFEAGMIGVNIGVPVPREPFSFGGWKESRFGVNDTTGESCMHFFTNLRKITTKWVPPKRRTWMD
eukprot:gnl/Trimastix_PCT/1020.p1 GENE.gnl/Trimastix_PCT/1020~~gnl/Trimastix_PCT/1020.p1  ORF type:complete len:508 (-),score=142.88 gnl/Trimastix_PCT/1020:54-1577(-)